MRMDVVRCRVSAESAVRSHTPPHLMPFAVYVIVVQAILIGRRLTQSGTGEEAGRFSTPVPTLFASANVFTTVGRSILRTVYGLLVRHPSVRP